MEMRKARPLDEHYTTEVEPAAPQTWLEALQCFNDANIYQAWSYGEVTAGRSNVSRLILRRKGSIVAAAQARVARLPILPAGIAYVLWGPLWRRSGMDEDEGAVFRQILRALRNEFVCKRGLTLRLFPLLFDQGDPEFAAVMAEEGFSPVSSEPRSRTILMDLKPSLNELREGMMAHWKRELKVADRNQLEIVSGTGTELFDEFIAIYKEMVSRKRFVEPNDINQFRQIQVLLPEPLKMKVMLCRSGGQLCSGVIYSAIGNTAVYLFGATSNVGMKSRGSYALQWQVIEELKRTNIAVYDLNGINPEKNPGTYKFKSDLAGRNASDVHFLGRFDSQGSFLSDWFVSCAQTVRSCYRSLRGWARSARTGRLWPNPAR